jgi:predicted DNA-binding protein
MSNKMNEIESKEMVTLSVNIPYELKDRLKFSSYKEKKPVKDIVQEAIKEYLDRQNKDQ